MGNTASSSQTQRANERAYIRSLGDRFPLGDHELRKWCWVHDRLSPENSLPVDRRLESAKHMDYLSILAVWSAIYGDYNPYTSSQSQSQTNNNCESNNNPSPIAIRIKHGAHGVMDAMMNVVKYIFPEQLSRQIYTCALGLPKCVSQIYTLEDPDEAAIGASEETYYSIASSVNQYMESCDSSSPLYTSQSSQGLDDFLEGISASCGRRGSRASLSKLFTIACPTSSTAKAKACDLISTAYRLALAASYLRAVAAERTQGNRVNVQDFVPQTDPKEMQSMVDSLLQSALEQRKNGGGLVGNYGFDYSPPDTTINAESGDDTSVNLQEFNEWAETCCPLLGSALPTFFHVLFNIFNPSNNNSKEPNFPPGVTPLWIPNLTVEQSKHIIHSSPTSTFFHAPSSSSFDLFALSCTSLTLASGRWHRLFSSEANGLSSNRLMHSIMGYGGPTIIIIRSKDTSSKGQCGSSVFGAFTFTPWNKESADFYGNSDCFLFRLGPDPMAVYRPSGGDIGGGDAFDFNKNTTSTQESDNTRNYMYYNPEARSKGYDGLAHGIGFGGTNDLPRLFIDEVLDGCRAASEDLTYEKGPLLSGLKESNSSGSHFEVEAMEAWGVGTSQLVEEALLARDGQREDKQKQIRKAMKGAKGQFLEDFQSGLTGAKMFQHKDQIQGREGDCQMNNNEEEEET